jgi:LmbE family N-acetylglucosaminyl deacetylase
VIDLKKKSLLILAPHPDDEILGCGGLIAKVKEAHGRVGVLVFSIGDRSKNPGTFSTSGQRRLGELNQAAKFLGFDFHVLYPDQYLEQVSLREVIKAINANNSSISLKGFNPDIVCMPAQFSLHQDHRVVAQAGLSALRPKEEIAKMTILSYEEITDLGTSSQPANFFVGLEKTHLEQKLLALQKYSSQIGPKGHTRHPKTIEALARVRGSLIGEEFAEAFSLHRVVL